MSGPGQGPSNERTTRLTHRKSLLMPYDCFQCVCVFFLIRGFKTQLGDGLRFLRFHSIPLDKCGAEVSAI